MRAPTRAGLPVPGPSGEPHRLRVYDSAVQRSAPIQEFIELLRYRDLLQQLISRDVKARYKRSVLGVTWTMANPLLTMSVMAWVFSHLFQFAVEHYVVYLLSGLVLWTFFAQTSSAVMSELFWGGALFQKIYVPPSVFAVAALGVGLVNLLLSLVPLAAIMLLSGVPMTPALLFLPVPILLTAMFTLGIGLMLSRLAISFADTVSIYQVLVSVWVYATPVMYPVNIISEEYRGPMYWNPLYYLLEVFRAPILQGDIPDPLMVAMASLFSTAVLVAGWWYFSRTASEFAYRA
jgi:ABC-2 type transport system permease protein